MNRLLSLIVFLWLALTSLGVKAEVSPLQLEIDNFIELMADELRDVEPDAYNFLGFSHHFKYHPDIINESHELAGVEYHLGGPSWIAYANFNDSYGVDNNAYTYHYRYEVNSSIIIGGLAGYVPKYEDTKFIMAPELILHRKGWGVRLMCLPNYRDLVGFCSMNIRIDTTYF